MSVTKPYLYSPLVTSFSISSFSSIRLNFKNQSGKQSIISAKVNHKKLSCKIMSSCEIPMQNLSQKTRAAPFPGTKRSLSSVPDADPVCSAFSEKTVLRTANPSSGYNSTQFFTLLQTKSSPIRLFPAILRQRPLRTHKKARRNSVRRAETGKPSRPLSAMLSNYCCGILLNSSSYFLKFSIIAGEVSRRRK